MRVAQFAGSRQPRTRRQPFDHRLEYDRGEPIVGVCNGALEGWHVVKGNGSVVARDRYGNAWSGGAPIEPPEIAAADDNIAAGIRAGEADCGGDGLRARLQELHSLRARHGVAESLGEFHFQRV